MWSSKLIQILIAILTTFYLLSFIYVEPDKLIETCVLPHVNPHSILQRGLLYSIIACYAEINILNKKQILLNSIICSIFIGLVVNEFTKSNQNWGLLHNTGLIISITLPLAQGLQIKNKNHGNNKIS